MQARIMDAPFQDLSLEQLIACVSKLGVGLRVSEKEDASLYSYVDCIGVPRYVGLTTGPSGRRGRDQDRWLESGEPGEDLCSGFQNVVHRKRLNRVRLTYCYSDSEVAVETLRTWVGPAIDEALEIFEKKLSAAQVEILLIRILVASGTPHFNSASASIWDSQTARPLDTAAQIAAGLLLRDL